MPRVRKPLVAAGVLLAAIALFGPAVDRARAQEPANASPATTTGPIDSTSTAGSAPLERVRHKHLFAASAHYGRRIPVKILKQNERNINDIFAPGSGIDGGLRCYPLEGMALGVRYSRGGLDMTDNGIDLARFPELDGSEYLKLDCYTLWVSAYLGGKLNPSSRINPYLTGSVSQYDWAFTHNGRDGTPYTILETVLEGKDLGVSGGLGCEYKLNDRLAIEAEWSWQYIFTELSRTDGDYAVWTNTHYWNLDLGLVLGF